ncbi:MAG: MBL fold metallo-hydrolase [Phycisphaerae bacterium]|nr:MBL fold metallo-hydrolase [Phycisphaerae bacterium]
MNAEQADLPKLIQVAEGLIVRQAVDNMAWIDLGEYAVVVDALEQPELETEVLSAIAKTLPGRSVRYVLNTHTHYDHVALNGALVRRHGAQVVDNASGAIGAPGRWFQGSRRKVQMLPMPSCHTEEDCVVWAPQEGVLFVGDIFGWGLIPLSCELTDQTGALLVQTVNRLIAFDAAVVVPGHGPLCSTAELKRWVEYLHWLVAEVRRAYQAGLDDKAILRQVPPPKDMTGWWRFLAWKHADSVTKVVQAVRRGKF